MVQDSLYGISRRGLLGASLALAACHPPARSQPVAALPPLKSLAPFPVGAAVQAVHLTDPALAALIASNASQLTPEWEMKMEYIVRDDGTFRFDAPDAIAAFARANGQRLFGHTLVWYAQTSPAFERLDERRVTFADAYRNYIHAVMSRYRGIATGWDVVNEPIAENGDGWRDSLWSRRLGDFDHIALAYRHAREADPQAALFINDYNLEWIPQKRTSFLRLVERMLNAGVPLDGVGTQTHIDAGLSPGELTRTIRDLAQFGLPVHVSEFDVSISRASNLLSHRAELERAQAALYGEAAEAFMALPARQRYAFTFWGLRDGESWLRREDASDTPAPFDAEGRPKPGARAWAERVG